MYAAAGLIGRHCVYDMGDSNPDLLDNEEFVKKALTEAAEAAGATLLNLVSHKFEPQGVTALALLAESHISIHTYPEYGYAAVDAFTCGEHTNPESACRSLKDSFESKSGSMEILTRRNYALSRHRILDAAR